MAETAQTWVLRFPTSHDGTSGDWQTKMRLEVNFMYCFFIHRISVYEYPHIHTHDLIRKTLIAYDIALVDVKTLVKSLFRQTIAPLKHKPFALFKILNTSPHTILRNA